MTAKEKKAFAARMQAGRARAAAEREGSTTKRAAPAKSKVKKMAATGKKTPLKASAKTNPRVVKGGLFGRVPGMTAAKTRKSGKLTGIAYLDERDRIAERIHRESATGQIIKMPVYRISIAKGKEMATDLLRKQRKAAGTSKAAPGRKRATATKTRKRTTATGTRQSARASR